MAVYHPMPAPILRLFRLTLQRHEKQSNVYSMGESVADAFARYLARLGKLQESAEGLEFVEGDLANPHARLND